MGTSTNAARRAEHPRAGATPGNSRRRPETVTILGGGIGGLALANALERVGIPWRLYERADALTEIGAGIGLSRGALTLLDHLGVGAEVRANARAIDGIVMADRHLRVRRRLPATYSGACIHRALLIDALKRPLPPERIHLGRRATHVRSDPDAARVTFADGSEIETECLIAADGVHSAARASLLPHVTIRWIDQTIWRGITHMDVPDLVRSAYIEVWDERLRFLTVPINAEETFWLAVQPVPPGGRDDPQTVRDDLQALFRSYHPVFRDLVRNSRNVLRNDMGDLGPPARHPWSVGRVAFLGDAIHATTPNLAQGGCQAIEDAVCLALCLRTHDDPEEAFAAYRRLRIAKVSYVVDTSWRFGVAAHSRNPVAFHAARMMLEFAPGWLLERQERRLSDLSYLSAVDANGAWAAG